MSYKSIILSIFSVILLILAFPKPGLEFLAWFALVPWFFVLCKQKPLGAFFLSYLVGLVFFSGIVYWVNYVSHLGFAVLIFYLALYFAVFGLFFSINHKQSTINNLLIIPSAWVSLEYLRSHLFSGFGWALLGYSQYKNIPLIQISDITGTYGVSFLIVLVNVGIYSIGNNVLKFKVRKEIIFPICCILVLVITVLSYGYFRLRQKPDGKNIKIAVVQGNIPQGMKWDPQAQDYILERYLRLTELAAQKKAELIVWPETAVPGFLEDDPRILEKLISLSQRQSPAYLLIGTPYQGELGEIYNSATLILKGKIIQRYDKVHLVPFGEFIPLPGIFARFSFAGLIGNFSRGEDYTVFSLEKCEPPLKLSTLICFEDVFGHLARRFVQQGAEVLVNITNDAWFGDSSEPEQHLQASVFRAVENRVNLVRSANTGISGFINPWGKILGKVTDDAGRDLLVEGERAEELKIAQMYSFYSAFGDIFAWLCLAASAVFILRQEAAP